jgi:hypothetical protein
MGSNVLSLLLVYSILAKFLTKGIVQSNHIPIISIHNFRKSAQSIVEGASNKKNGVVVKDQLTDFTIVYGLKDSRLS